VRPREARENRAGEQGEREPEFGEGIIEISGKGFGFLRDPKRNSVSARSERPALRSAYSASTVDAS